MQSAIDATLAGLDQDVFEDIRIGEAPSDNDWQGMWCYATVRGQSWVDGGAIAAAWQADLAQGAIAERLADDGEPNLANVVPGSTFKFRSADGELTPLSGGAGDITAGQSFGDGLDMSDSAIRASIDEAVAAFGMKVSVVRIFHPLQAAVHVVVTVNDISDLRGNYSPVWNAILGDPYAYEGLYLEFDSTDGTPLVRGSGAFRTGSGRLWFAPGYDEIAGALHGGMPQD